VAGRIHLSSRSAGRDCGQWAAGPWATALAVFLLLASGSAFATCFPVAQGQGRVIPAALPGPGSVRLTFLGHSSFLIETPGGATAITDYNGSIRTQKPPAVVTMNNAHSTHYSNYIEPGIEHALEGWGEGGGFAIHDLTYEDLRIRNVPTNVRDFGGTRYNGNSIFVFETQDLCIAHLGHLHHLLTDDHLGKLGVIDVLLVPADGTWTAAHEIMVEVIHQIAPRMVIPMHYFNSGVLARFISLLEGRYEPVFLDQPVLEVSQVTMPYHKLIVMPGL
jgi:L-ascorbate metabolism protein UlaG (beta-lactamase superfamily)